MSLAEEELYKGNARPLYGTVALVTIFWIQNYSLNSPIQLNQQTLVILIFSILLILVGINSYVTNYLKIVNLRTLINSGYHSFRKDEVDISNIKYIYRFSDYVLPWFGSRMIFYISAKDGSLKQLSLREQNYTTNTIKKFLNRVKQIKPSIELDPEYELLLKDELYINDISQNTVKSIEARLSAKGERPH